MDLFYDLSKLPLPEATFILGSYLGYKDNFNTFDDITYLMDPFHVYQHGIIIKEEVLSKSVHGMLTHEIVMVTLIGNRYFSTPVKMKFFRFTHDHDVLLTGFRWYNDHIKLTNDEYIQCGNFIKSDQV